MKTTYEISKKSLRPRTKSSYTLTSPVNQWIIQNALRDIDEVDDQKVETVAILTGSSNDDIIRYLLQHDWTLTPALTGIRYARNPGKKVLSKISDSKCAR